MEVGPRARVRIFHALDPDTGRAVKLKLLADVTDKALAERFRREVATVARLRSPGIVAIYELGEHVGLPFAAMQCFGDDHLGLAIKSQRTFTILEKATMMWQVAEGVRAAHHEGLSSVGIRPSGIALASDGSAAIQDFGVVRLTGGEQNENALYNAPEEFTSGFVPDSRCDVFAFGVVYFELLTGTHPFLAGSSSESMLGILHREPFRMRELLPECPEALEQLVRRALDKRRQFRYASFDEIQEDAEPILQELKSARTAAAHGQRPRGTEDPEVRQLLAEARCLLGQQQLPEAHAKAVEALGRDPQNPRAVELLAAISGDIERRARQARTEEELERAKSLLLLRSFDEALSILLQMREDGAHPRIIEQWIAHVRAQKADHERQNRIEACASQARSLMEGQRFTEAADLLAMAVAEFASDGTLQDLLVQAREGLEKARAIQDALSRCDQACRGSDFAAGCQILDKMLAAYPAERVLMERRRAVEDDWAKLKLTTAVHQALDEVDWMLEQDRPDVAAKFLRAKTVELVDAPALVARLTEIEQNLPEWEQRRFLRFLHDYSMSRVAALEQLEQWPVALAVLEEALVSCPASGDMFEAAERLRRRLGEQEQLNKLARRLEAIHQKIAAEAWQPALDLLDEAQQEFPGETQLQALLELARDGLRRCECDSLSAKVRHRVADGEIAEAGELLRKALESFGPEPSLISLQQEVEMAAQCHEERRKTQFLCARRSFNEAEETLLRLGGPGRPEVETLLALVHQARAEDEKQFILQCRRKANGLIEQQAFEQAADWLAHLRLLYPENGELQNDAKETSVGGPLSGHAAPNRPVAVAATTEQGHLESPGFQTAMKLARSASALSKRALRTAVILTRQASAVSKESVENFRLRAQGAGAVWKVLVATALVLAAVIWVGVGLRSGARERQGMTAWKLSRPRVSTQAAEQVKAAAPQSPAKSAAVAQAPTVSAEVLSQQVIASPEVFKTRKTGGAEPRQAPPRPFNTPALSISGVGQAVVLPAAPIAVPPPGPSIPSGVPPLIAQIATRLAPSEAPPENRAAASPPPPSNYQAPKALTATAPRYPALAKQRDVSGDVVLEATVSKQGTVSRLIVVRGDPLLSGSAVEAVRRWRYQPATLGGQPVEAKVAITVTFRTNDK